MKRLAGALLLIAPAVAPAQLCRVDAPPLQLGRYDPASPHALVARTEIAVRCEDSGREGVADAVVVRLGGERQRSLHGGASVLAYALFRDAALLQPWWSGAPAAVALDGDGRGRERRVAVYAQVAPGQWVAPGSYADLVEVQIEF